jgi:hypothetical protein
LLNICAGHDACSYGTVVLICSSRERNGCLEKLGRVPSTGEIWTLLDPATCNIAYASAFAPTGRPIYIFRHQRSNTEPGYAAAAGGHVRAWRQKDGREPHHVVITGTASSRQQSNAMQSGKAIKLKTWADRWMRRGRSGKRVNPKPAIMSR